MKVRTLHGYTFGLRGNEHSRRLDHSQKRAAAPGPQKVMKLMMSWIVFTQQDVSSLRHAATDPEKSLHINETPAA